MHLMHTIGPKTHVLGRFGPFRYYTKLDAKLPELAPLTPKFAKRSCVGSFWGILDRVVTFQKSMQNWPN
jgi:hypothetical protein